MAWDYSNLGNIQMNKDNKQKPQRKGGKGLLLVLMAVGIWYIMTHNARSLNNQSPSDTVQSFTSNALDSFGVTNTLSASQHPCVIDADSMEYHDEVDQNKNVQEYYHDLNTSTIKF